MGFREVDRLNLGRQVLGVALLPHLLQACRQQVELILAVFGVEPAHRKGIQEASGIVTQSPDIGLVHLSFGGDDRQAGAEQGLRFDGVPIHRYARNDQWQRIQLWRDLCAASKICVCQESSEFHRDIVDPDRADRNRLVPANVGNRGGHLSYARATPSGSIGRELVSGPTAALSSGSTSANPAVQTELDEGQLTANQQTVAPMECRKSAFVGDEEQGHPTQSSHSPVLALRRRRRAVHELRCATQDHRRLRRARRDRQDSHASGPARECAAPRSSAADRTAPYGLSRQRDTRPVTIPAIRLGPRSCQAVKLFRNRAVGGHVAFKHSSRDPIFTGQRAIDCWLGGR